MYVDCHSHIHVREFDQDREVVIQRARDAGVSTLINVGFDTEGNFHALALAKKYDFIYATMGIHPHLADEWNEHVARKITDAVRTEPKIVALGEMGLDYYKNFQPKELQQHVFKEQLKIAQELNLPVIIHCRDAFEDTFKILDEIGNEKVLMHCFTGTIEEARECWKRGYYMAFTGIITYPTAEDLRQVVKECPIDKLLIETDCPYLAPQRHRGKRNEPAFLVETAQQVIATKGLSEAVFQKQLLQNIKILFGIPLQS